MFNCIQLAFDVTHEWERRGDWIPRDENQVCDALAHSAVADGDYTVVTSEHFASHR